MSADREVEAREKRLNHGTRFRHPVEVKHEIKFTLMIHGSCLAYFSVLFVPEQVTLIKVQLYDCIVVFNFNVSLESCQYIWKSIFGPSLFSGVKMC